MRVVGDDRVDVAEQQHPAACPCPPGARAGRGAWPGVEHGMPLDRAPRRAAARRTRERTPRPLHVARRRRDADERLELPLGAPHDHHRRPLYQCTMPAPLLKVRCAELPEIEITARRLGPGRKDLSVESTLAPGINALKPWTARPGKAVARRPGTASCSS